jgi:iron complex transport system permease protein
VRSCCRPGTLFTLLLALGGLALVLALDSGSDSASLADLMPLRAGAVPELGREIVLELRLPRALSAFAVGGLLALAGTLMQVLLRNPLGDPYVLGVSGAWRLPRLDADRFRTRRPRQVWT